MLENTQMECPPKSQRARYYKLLLCGDIGNTWSRWENEAYCKPLSLDNDTVLCIPSHNFFSFSVLWIWAAGRPIRPWFLLRYALYIAMIGAHFLICVSQIRIVRVFDPCARVSQFASIASNKYLNQDNNMLLRYSFIQIPLFSGIERK